MDLQGVINFISTIGLGGIIGASLKMYFDGRQQRKKMLFDARVKAYSGITARLGNNFLESDISRESKAKRFSQINSILSDAFLLGSPALCKTLNKYIPALHGLHDALYKDVKNGTITSDSALAEVTRLSILVQNQMKKDLYLKGAADIKNIESIGINPEEVR